MSTVEIPTEQAVVSLITKFAAGDLERMKEVIKRFCGEDAKLGHRFTDEQQRIAITAHIEAEMRAGKATPEIPKAHHLCTDQANANRLELNFGNRLISVNGEFLAWQGTHWARDGSEAHRCAAKLSAIVAQEAKKALQEYDALAKQETGIALAALKHPQKSDLGKSEAGRKLIAARSKAEALQKWGQQCEMKSRQDAALGLLRSMLDFKAANLDADPWALNCLSGTIDLRTGQLRPHNPDDYITRCAPVAFEPLAKAPTFERFVREVVSDDETAAFLQRWFGYCATGDVREHKMAIHIGPGRNGKGTLIRAISSVLGEYAQTAAQGLLADGGKNIERHPTEIARMRGMRMVTAHEPDNGAVLREGFVKQATGGDSLVGRGMHKDFSEFDPTHKLQLLTNYKPVVKGQDRGIWSRLLIINFPFKYGSAAEVQKGEATRIKNPALDEDLRAERAGIFAWLVRGAIEWARIGLEPPESVLAAGDAYKRDQDRIGQFVAARCLTGPEAWVPYTGPGGIYPAYKFWCNEGGFSPLSLTQFLQQLELSVPAMQRIERKLNIDGRRKGVGGVKGLRLDEDAQESEFADQDAPKQAPAPKPSKAKTPVAKAALPAVEEVLDTSWMYEEPAKATPTKTPKQELMRQLGIDEGTADRFVEEGFGTIEEIRAPGFVRIPGFSEGFLRDIQNRARDLGN
jgi:putative DNA primase/helicase